MELLIIEHTDFTMSIECGKFDAIWTKAKNNVGEAQLHSVYSWSSGVTKVTHRAAGHERELVKGESAPAVFFDNADYPIWVEFAGEVKEAQFGSTLESENERFSFRRHILTGYLNYGNEIGRSEICLVYRVKDEVRRFTFSFEVLSTKLDYHDHWRRIIEDIEREYRMLSLDYMRRTFHGFTPDQNGETPELVWWSIFASEQQKFVTACKNIIERPRHRLKGRTVYVRADELTTLTPDVENELAEHRREANRLYRVSEQIQSHDTMENRFLKYALAHITQQYQLLKARIEEINAVSEVTKRDMQQTLTTLMRLGRHPFFRGIGRFNGMTQESLVLQRASGYSQVYRTWNLLRRGYSLYDGLYRLQTKDIATLYEIWCFIELSHIVKEQLRLTDEEVDHRNRMEMNGLFTWEMGKGQNSRILFKKDNVELAELVYNPKHTNRENESISIKDLVVPTVPQKPDIVLQLTKNDLGAGMKMTYLFDAKYRIDGRERGADTPPDDAINQMHRYRDAIYYRDHQTNALKKEVVGGYILFPGDGTPLQVQEANFYKTIAQVNIGAFPLRPKDEENRRLLEEFVATLIERKSYQTIDEVIAHKGAIVDVGHRVLIGLVRPSNRKGYFKSFEDGQATLYYTGSKFPTSISLHGLHYFMPYFKGKGIRDVYEIVKVRTITSKEVFQTEDDEGANDIRLAFELRFVRQQYADFRPIHAERLSDYTFGDTTFDGLEAYLKT